MRNEELIFKNLLYNEEYLRKVIPFLQPEYFVEKSDKIVFNIINEHFEKYNAVPTIAALSIILNNKKGIAEYDHKDCTKLVQELGNGYEPQNIDWLLTFSEKFCKDKAVFNAIMASINIIDGNDKQFSQDHIPELLNKALAVGFDKDIGHDYFENAEDRYDKYVEVEDKIPFDIDILNKITRGGMVKKALYLALGGTGGFKTGTKCHIAAATIKQGYNVLYITLEMAEERISERIDANLTNIPIDELSNVGKDVFLSRINKLAKKSYGRLIVKEYPAKTITAANIKYLIEELQQKKNFMPDLLIVDYLGLLASTTYRNSKNINSYTYAGEVAVELRSLAQYFNIPVWSSVQTNRSGLSNSDPELENVADSHGISTVADFFVALYASEEMESMNQLLVKVLKNRFNAKNFYKRFLVGVDKPHMRLYNLEQPNGNISMPDSKTEMASKPSLSFDNWS
jgi:replicative DNA helicase